MRVLSNVRPTSEQLLIINDYHPGTMVIRGAAGSGKTTTAVLRLRHVVNVWRGASQRATGRDVRVLVLSFNRTLRGYVEELVRSQVRTDNVELRLDTFAGWAYSLAGSLTMTKPAARESKIAALGVGLGLPREFLIGEADYVAGRYPERDWNGYLNQSDREIYRRHGRGASPAMPQERRQRLVDEVLVPYRGWKESSSVADWHDVAIRAAGAGNHGYDIVVVDEAQDFSANMVRAIRAHVSAEHSLTFVLDATQRVYPHRFTWREVGLDVRPGRDVHTLRTNHRNTQRIAALARPLVAHLPSDDDSALPDFSACEVPGDIPTVIRGSFTAQMDAIIDFISGLPDDESIALLHPKGGGWFKYVKQRLGDASLAYIDLQRRKDWPQGEEEIGLSTLHSVKGLEFDHVVLLGLEEDHMPFSDADDDTQLAQHRRLLAMAIGRARRTVMITHKPETAPRVLSLLDPGTFTVDER